jgi:RNA polymerase sigma-70 factor (ECF subfamily)
MGSRKHSERLSRIKTRWTMVFQAHQGQGQGMTSAQHRLLLGYYGPVYRYLRAMVGDEDAAEELTQEFAVRFLRGDFKRADPARGRFRDLLKQALRHLAIDHWRRRQLEKEKTPVPLAEERQGRTAHADWHSGPPARVTVPARDEDAAVTESSLLDLEAQADRTFLESWRGKLLNRALARFQTRAGRPYEAALRLRMQYPGASSTDLAGRLSTRLGKPVSETAYRQMLRRARATFADFLVAEVAATLPASDPDAIEAELIELNLLSHCRGTVARLREWNSLEH